MSVIRRRTPETPVELNEAAKALDKELNIYASVNTYFVMPVNYPEHLCVFIENRDTFDRLSERAPNTYQNYDVKLTRIE